MRYAPCLAAGELVRILVRLLAGQPHHRQQLVDLLLRRGMPWMRNGSMRVSATFMRGLRLE